MEHDLPVGVTFSNICYELRFDLYDKYLVIDVCLS